MRRFLFPDGIGRNAVFYGIGSKQYFSIIDNAI